MKYLMSTISLLLFLFIAYGKGKEDNTDGFNIFSKNKKIKRIDQLHETTLKVRSKEKIVAINLKKRLTGDLIIKAKKNIHVWIPAECDCILTAKSKRGIQMNEIEVQDPVIEYSAFCNAKVGDGGYTVWLQSKKGSILIKKLNEDSKSF